jgi:hypothetical protein
MRWRKCNPNTTTASIINPSVVEVWTANFSPRRPRCRSNRTVASIATAVKVGIVINQFVVVADTVVMLMSSIVIITSTLHYGHDEWCVMIISVWCVFSKLLRPSWISKYIMKTESNSITIGHTGRWLFCHHCRTTCHWWSRWPSPSLFVRCGRGQ